MMNRKSLSSPGATLARMKSRFNWVRLGEVGSVLLLLAAAFVIVSYARNMDWQGVVSALRSYAAPEIGAAAAFTLSSFALYSCFDLFGRHYTGSAIATWRVLIITSISYAFNLTLGSIVGAAGMRFRLYGQQGIQSAKVARIIAISVGINWLGYAALAGMLFVAGLVQLPTSWDVRPHLLPLLGWGLIAAVILYLAATLRFGDRSFCVGGRRVCLPKTSTALLQLALGGLNWMLMGAVLYSLLQGRIAYPMTLAVIMVSSVAGIISRIPGGIGVLEAVSIAILQPELAQTKIIAAVLVYRAIYYLTPLLLATIGFVVFEAAERRRPLADV